MSNGGSIGAGTTPGTPIGGRLAAAQRNMVAQGKAMAINEASDESISKMPLPHQLQYRKEQAMHELQQIEQAQRIMAEHPEVEETLKLMDVLASLGMR